MAELTPAPDTLAQWLAYVEGLHPSVMELGLDRVRTVYERLQRVLPGRVIVVGGTNGKGSTCAMLEAIYQAAGYRVGCYTSPHLVSFAERIRRNGTPVSDTELLPHFARVEAARRLSPEVSLTWFEFTTLVAFCVFAAEPLDVTILEVGLGGRLDAVNLIDADVAVVTSIDLDHQAWLGNDREAIGFEKAHIFRAGRPAVCGDPVPPASVIAHAESLGADLWLFGRDFNYQGDRQQWSWAGRSARRHALAFPALRGANQLLNASGVLAVLECLRSALPVSQQAVRVGLATVDLPGRFQVLPGRPAVVLDVAHNPHAAAVLATNLDQMGYFPETYAIVGMMQDKDIAGAFKHLLPKVTRWCLCTLPGPRGAQAAQLQEVLLSLAPESVAECYETPEAAFGAAYGHCEQEDRVVVFGSFVTVGEVLPVTAKRDGLRTGGLAK